MHLDLRNRRKNPPGIQVDSSALRIYACLFMKSTRTRWSSHNLSTWLILRLNNNSSGKVCYLLLAWLKLIRLKTFFKKNASCFYYKSQLQDKWMNFLRHSLRWHRLEFFFDRIFSRTDTVKTSCVSAIYGQSCPLSLTISIWTNL
jgi:hypothetical protein